MHEKDSRLINYSFRCQNVTVKKSKPILGRWGWVKIALSRVLMIYCKRDFLERKKKNFAPKLYRLGLLEKKYFAPELYRL